MPEEMEKHKESKDDLDYMKKEEIEESNGLNEERGEDDAYGDVEYEESKKDFD